MWQLSQSSQSLRPHVKTNGNYAVLSATPFPAGFDFAAAHKYSITVTGTTVVTKVDGAVLDTRTVTPNTAPGLVGFRTSGDEKGTVSDVKVTSKSGSVLLDTTFPSGDRSFTAGTRAGWRPPRLGQHRVLVRIRRGRAGAPYRVHRGQGSRVGARIYAAARGLYELQLNGQPRRRPRARARAGPTTTRASSTRPTTSPTCCDAGDNALGAEIADGWYPGGRHVR